MPWERRFVPLCLEAPWENSAAEKRRRGWRRVVSWLVNLLRFLNYTNLSGILSFLLLVFLRFYFVAALDEHRGEK